jgi:hypothetical protein
MTTTTRHTKGSGGTRGTGAPPANTRAPVASAPPAGAEGEDVFLTLDELLDLLRLAGPDRCEAAIREAPVCVLGGGQRRWLKSQVITWAALGGTRPRHRTTKRGVRRWGEM